jgi:hypothetical protein
VDMQDISESGNSVPPSASAPAPTFASILRTPAPAPASVITASTNQSAVQSSITSAYIHPSFSTPPTSQQSFRQTSQHSAKAQRGCRWAG